MAARIRIRKIRLARYARVAGALSVPVLALAGLANRFDLMPFYAVLPTLITGFLLATGALVLSIFALMTIWKYGGRGASSAAAGAIYALPALMLAGMAVFAIFAYPPIADVTTDAGDPPQFRVLRPDGASDSATGSASARFYPVGIGPVYAAITGIIADKGWSVALAIAPAGEDGTAWIEATATSLLFAFKDDVAIRLIGTANGTRIDMRSASRWGRHDLGQNGRRIRAFMGGLDLALQGLFTAIEEPAEEPAEEAAEERVEELAEEGVEELVEEPVDGAAGGGI